MSITCPKTSFNFVVATDVVSVTTCMNASPRSRRPAGVLIACSTVVEQNPDTAVQLSWSNISFFVRLTAFFCSVRSHLPLLRRDWLRLLGRPFRVTGTTTRFAASMASQAFLFFGDADVARLATSLSLVGVRLTCVCVSVCVCVSGHCVWLCVRVAVCKRKPVTSHKHKKKIFTRGP